MNITLLPHQEKVVEAAINAGVIHSVEEWIDSAIAYVPNAILAGSSAAKATNLVELFDPVEDLGWCSVVGFFDVVWVLD